MLAEARVSAEWPAGGAMSQAVHAPGAGNTPQAMQLHLVSGGLDRAAERRADPGWMRAALADEAAVVMWVGHGSVAVGEDPDGIALMLAPGDSGIGSIAAVDSGTSHALQDLADLSFLGVDAAGRACFAVHVSQAPDELPDHTPGGAARWMTLRELGLRLPGEQASMAVTAVALDNWRRRTRRCPGCGADLVPRQAGWALYCEAEDVEHFPRTDPAAIVLVRDGQDRALLGRHVNWQPGWMSTIAGFVEAGESAEAAVRREVQEETGVRIGASDDHLAYLGSQPWPFPASLMLGYHAWVDREDPSANRIEVDGSEIAEARWLSREDLRSACAANEVRLPPRLSISRFLIERWYGEPLPGDWMRG
jgi:NAD+ diphosphatase